MLRDLLRFYREAPRAAGDWRPSLGAFLEQDGYGAAFRDDHLFPMAAAIWSTPAAEIRDYPALPSFASARTTGSCSSPTGRSGGQSRAEAAPMSSRSRAPPRSHPPRPRRAVRRHDDGVKIATPGRWRPALRSRGDRDARRSGACHARCADRRGARCSARSAMARTVRSCIATPLMPRADASGQAGIICRPQRAGGDLSVTYWMNRLQGLPSAQPVFLTLNPTGKSGRRSCATTYASDLRRARLAAQKRLWSLQGGGTSGFAARISGPDSMKMACSRAWLSPRRWAGCEALGRGGRIGAHHDSAAAAARASVASRSRDGRPALVAFRRSCHAPANATQAHRCAIACSSGCSISTSSIAGRALRCSRATASTCSPSTTATMATGRAGPAASSFAPRCAPRPARRWRRMCSCRCRASSATPSIRSASPSAIGPMARSAAILYEVNNTFGQRHTYLIPAGPTQTGSSPGKRQTLYVSPFLDMDMSYAFVAAPPNERVAISIIARDKEGPVLIAKLSGDRTRSQTQRCSALFCLSISDTEGRCGIHWEALRLWLKGVGLTPRPEQPNDQTRWGAPRRALRL